MRKRKVCGRWDMEGWERMTGRKYRLVMRRRESCERERSAHQCPLKDFAIIALAYPRETSEDGKEWRAGVEWKKGGGRKEEG